MTEFELMLMNELLKAAAAIEMVAPANIKKRASQLADLKLAPGAAQYWDDDRLDKEWQLRCGPHAAQIQAQIAAGGEEALMALMQEMTSDE